LVPGKKKDKWFDIQKSGPGNIQQTTEMISKAEK